MSPLQPLDRDLILGCMPRLGLPGDRPAAALSAHSTSSEQRPDSKPPDRGPSPEDAANDWIDQHVLPAINAQVQGLHAHL